VEVGYRCPMAWGTAIPAVITAGVAFLGVAYGAYLSKSREMQNWTREQRLKSYIELLGAIENCYEAFTLIAASLDLAKYDESARKDQKIISTSLEWGKWDSEIDRHLPLAELVSSKHNQPYITYIRHGIRSRHRMLLMKLAYGQEIDQKEWKFVSSKTQGDILDIRRRLREDLTYIDLEPSPFRSLLFRWRIIRRRAAKRLHVSRTKERHDIESALRSDLDAKPKASQSTAP
jgi:hypothetical protein